MVSAACATKSSSGITLSTRIEYRGRLGTGQPHQSFCMRRGGKVGVAQYDLIAMAHAGKHMQQVGGQQRRETFKHAMDTSARRCFIFLLAY